MVCNKCGVEKEPIEYSPSSLKKMHWCKECIKIKSRNYAEKNKDKIKEKKKLYRQTNKDKIISYNKKYYSENVDFVKDTTKKYASSNKEKRNSNARNRRALDLNYKLSSVLRTRINNVIRDGQKAGSAVKDLGCSMKELKEYLESKFQEGMTWENHSPNGWHIDHIKPLCNFDLSNREQFLEACHYTNLQPLWAVDNIKKGGRYE